MVTPNTTTKWQIGNCFKGKHNLQNSQYKYEKASNIVSLIVEEFVLLISSLSISLGKTQKKKQEQEQTIKTPKDKQQNQWFRIGGKDGLLRDYWAYVKVFSGFGQWVRSLGGHIFLMNWVTIDQGRWQQVFSK